ncbi:MAG: nucleotidyltransferase domain-containing protein [Desulfococcaceae bacterium]|jgi:predicted nucleotidyltransferase|nr:nucleotidyltransferase domain-containing protein [Desulfococcaceae bacterium]
MQNHLCDTEKMAVFRKTARRKMLREKQEQKHRREKSLVLAKKAAEMLKEKFGAKQVFLFGSLSRNTVYDRLSDIDLAVSGMDGRAYYRAVSRLLDMEPETEFDLVMLENALPGLLQQIQKEGKEL